MKLIIYLLTIGLVVFISLCLYTIPSQTLPITKNRTSVLIYTDNVPNLDLQTEYGNLVNIYEAALITLSNINTQIVILQNTLRALEDQIIQIRNAYLVKENNILIDIKNNLTNIRMTTFSSTTIQTIIDNYNLLDGFIQSNMTSLTDYFTTLNNNMNLIEQYLQTIKTNYILIDSLNPFLTNITFGTFVQQEVDGLTSSIACRNQPQFLLSLCQTNNIAVLNSTYIPLPIVATTGNNILITDVTDKGDIILNITPLTF